MTPQGIYSMKIFVSLLSRNSGQFQVNLVQKQLNFGQNLVEISLIFSQFIINFSYFHSIFYKGQYRIGLEISLIFSQFLARFSLNFIENGWILLSNLVQNWFSNQRNISLEFWDFIINFSLIAPKSIIFIFVPLFINFFRIWVDIWS